MFVISGKDEKFFFAAHASPISTFSLSLALSLSLSQQKAQRAQLDFQL